MVGLNQNSAKWSLSDVLLPSLRPQIGVDDPQTGFLLTGSGKKTVLRQNADRKWEGEGILAPL
jgi:hypothetical protein